MKIALAGGGQGAVTVLDDLTLFEGYDIVGVADLNEDAPGMRRPREHGIETTTDMLSLLRQPELELVIELTGSGSVLETIESNLGPEQQVILANGARLLVDLITAQQEHNARMVTGVTSRFQEVISRLSKIFSRVDASYESIQRLLREGKVVSINANVEAARAGAAGVAFSVVVHRIRELVGSIEEAAATIGDAASETSAALDEFAQAEAELRESFGGTGFTD